MDPKTLITQAFKVTLKFEVIKEMKTWTAVFWVRIQFVLAFSRLDFNDKLRLSGVSRVEC